MQIPYVLKYSDRPSTGKLYIERTGPISPCGYIENKKRVSYIHLNPVRAGLAKVTTLKRYSLSSFPKFFLKKRPACLDARDWLAAAGDLVYDISKAVATETKSGNKRSKEWQKLGTPKSKA